MPTAATTSKVTLPRTLRKIRGSPHAPQPRDVGGARVASKTISTGDPPPVTVSPSVAQEKGSAAISVAVIDFLADLRLSGSERVFGALAIALAEGMEAAPLYAKAKFAHELRGIVADLAEGETSPANLALLRGIDL